MDIQPHWKTSTAVAQSVDIGRDHGRMCALAGTTPSLIALWGVQGSKRRNLPAEGSSTPGTRSEKRMSTIYSTKVTAVSGRAGSVKSEDGLLDLQLALPNALGGKGGATNPEQLFAAGYSACFENAVIHSARSQKIHLKDDAIIVVAEVGIGPNGEGGFVLSVALDVTITGLDQAKAEDLVKSAHAVCPYSNAVKGNIDVSIKVTAL